jgi:hypothetical protein
MHRLTLISRTPLDESSGRAVGLGFTTYEMAVPLRGIVRVGHDPAKS